MLFCWFKSGWVFSYTGSPTCSHVSLLASRFCCRDFAPAWHLHLKVASHTSLFFSSFLFGCWLAFVWFFSSFLYSEPLSASSFQYAFALLKWCTWHVSFDIVHLTGSGLHIAFYHVCILWIQGSYSPEPYNCSLSSLCSARRQASSSYLLLQSSQLKHKVQNGCINRKAFGWVGKSVYSRAAVPKQKRAAEWLWHFNPDSRFFTRHEPK